LVMVKRKESKNPKTRAREGGASLISLLSSFVFSVPPSVRRKVLGAKPKQAGKKEGGWGEGIFALLRLKLERFRFPLIKRNPKQKIFHILLKEKKEGEKIKNVLKKFLFCFAVAERRRAETHRQNYHALRA